MTCSAWGWACTSRGSLPPRGGTGCCWWPGSSGTACTCTRWRRPGPPAPPSPAQAAARHVTPADREERTNYNAGNTYMEEARTFLWAHHWQQRVTWHQLTERGKNQSKRGKQGVTKWCRLSWLTNSAHVYESKCEGGGCGVPANEYSCTQD
jgi:hypothetical protein